ncbi:hypothetical protein Gotri_000089 [Gossypium trilobum]|uniref:Uncharacterized protein n=1 Tax=Gossypium trilobum TaxID=34281 RepID=A0A7J9FHA2_9ROSI|nr:hypothetical protein [Gossypium trilobum]
MANVYATIVIKANENRREFRPIEQINMGTRMENVPISGSNIFIGYKKNNIRTCVVILIKGSTKEILKKTFGHVIGIKGKPVIAFTEGILPSVVFWTQDKLLGKVFAGDEIRVNWEITPLRDDIVAIQRGLGKWGGSKNESSQLN